ncbi:hypothetical protein EV121DRAFT_274849, partial [Schizophyllum commune]
MACKTSQVFPPSTIQAPQSLQISVLRLQQSLIAHHWETPVQSQTRFSNPDPAIMSTMCLFLTATASQLSAFPRSMFSERDMDTVIWLARQCGADISHTVNRVNASRDKVTEVYGPECKMHQGALGNPFAMLDFGKILADEWANPLVRPHIHTYAEDAGEKLNAPYHGAKWREEVKAVLSGPMVRAPDGRDYYVQEPALAVVGPSRSVQPVMPTRWFLRDGNLWGRVQALGVVSDGSATALAIDARIDCFELPLSAFLESYEELRHSYTAHNLPEPSRVEGVILPDGTFKTSPISAPNPYRVHAKGRLLFSVPIWVYCDDTSGNTSKKWNKHNSLLFTLAGLPPDVIHLLFNIHFLATSNIASPLEMFEALVNQLSTSLVREIQEKGGVEAYDCELKQVVLLLPWILGLNEDNPMQSEFASHIGLTGKCFCRACHARNDARSRTAGEDVERDRISAFLFARKDNERTKEFTLKTLNEQLAAVLDGAPTRAEKLQTETGVKDKYFQYFFERLAA